MIINGCVVKIGDEDEAIVDAIAEFLDLNGIDDEIENETLGYLSNGIHRIEFESGDYSDFELSVKEPGQSYSKNFRFISKDFIDDKFQQECEERFDDDAWREDVANMYTEDGLEDWQQDKFENTSFEELFSTYDESYHDELDDTGYHVFKV